MIVLKLLESCKNKYDKAAYIYNNGRTLVLLDCTEEAFTQVFQLINQVDYVYIFISSHVTCSFDAARNIVTYCKCNNKGVYVYTPKAYYEKFNSKCSAALESFHFIDFNKSVNVNFSAMSYNIKFVLVPYTADKCLISIEKFESGSAPLTLIYTGYVEIIPDPKNLFGGNNNGINR